MSDHAGVFTLFASRTADVRSCRFHRGPSGRVNLTKPRLPPAAPPTRRPSRNHIEIIRLRARRRLAARLRGSSVRSRRALRQPARRLPVRDPEPPQAHCARQPRTVLPRPHRCAIPANGPGPFPPCDSQLCRARRAMVRLRPLDRTAGAARKPHRPDRRARAADHLHGLSLRRH